MAWMICLLPAVYFVAYVMLGAVVLAIVDTKDAAYFHWLERGGLLGYLTFMLWPILILAILIVRIRRRE